MKSISKILIPIFGIACASLMTQVSAHTPGDQMSSDQASVITPDAGPRVAHGADVIISADFIFWAARQDGLGYVMSGFGAGATSVGRGNVHHVGTDWDPGFKAGIGLGLGHDGWDVMLEYTWLHSHDSSNTVHTNTPANSTLYPLWNIANHFNDPKYFNNRAPVISAFANWDLHFNMFDLELGRNYYISTYLTLRPHVGLKGGWINQDYSVRYRANISSVEDDNWRIRNDQDYWGVGIRAGLDTAWYFITNFCLYGDFALTGMWSSFDVDRRDTRENLATVTTPTRIAIINTQNDFHSVKPVLEFGLGLRYETWFSNNDYHFAIQAGWEEQIWISHNQLLHLMEESAHGDLSLQGLTLKVRFDF